jgi:CubicO group peptidase (beta-lactamase class C family)
MNKLNLDDPINKYLPFDVVNPNFPNIPITIRQLATHTSSIQDKDFYWYHSYILKNVANNKNTNDSIPFYFKEQKDNIELADFLQKRFEKSGEWYNSDIYLNKKPNEVYEYSNIGSALCAYVIELATGIPYNDFTKQNILKPLEMKSSGWFFNEVNFDNYATIYSNSKIIPPYSLITYPDGGFITSSEDLAKLLTEFIKGYNGKGTLLNENSYKEIFKSQVKDIPEDEDVERIGIFIEFGEEGIGHSGGDPGINSLMFFNPKTNIGRVLITNTDSNKDEWGNDFWAIWNTMEKQKIE